MSTIKNLFFSTEKCNTGRQTELDLAKGFAIVFMVWVHITEILNAHITDHLGKIAVMHFLGGSFAAPVFMICMGIGIVYAKNSNPEVMIKRGWHLLKIALILNFLRFVLPLILDVLLYNEGSFIDFIVSFLEVDILQFAALAFLFFGVLFKYSKSNRTLFGVIVITAILAVLLRNVATGNQVIDTLLGYFWTVENHTYFPFLNWIIFPTSGILIGRAYQHFFNKDRFFKIFALPCFAIGLGYQIYCFIHKIGMFATVKGYYYLNAVDAFFMILQAIGLFGIYYALSKLFSTERFSFLLGISRNINEVYIVHWLIISYSTYIFSVLELIEWDFWQSTLFSAVVLWVSAILGKKLSDKGWVK